MIGGYIAPIQQPMQIVIENVKDTSEWWVPILTAVAAAAVTAYINKKVKK